ncbi:myxosortase-dependent phytase-like phosphatase [Vitiosangium sp. GDMCC 1.1324]|uniref:myxosortase-dependent phytase-like phosphatase n=1 Tax=Vitiosangium sp. (strain GDMCC 1.1324) TaxID=2138576 RepID=UPI00130D79C8|nr:myxosortase-dependent phytase-like phosphatase [Vitiosangium sp. GDMCC 1.1324]
MRFRTFLALAALLTGLPVLAQQTLQVTPTLETQPVLGTGPVVQGAALWPHPTDPANSLLLVADNLNGLLIYNLNGTQRALLAEGAVLGVDVQEGVSVAGITQTVVVVANAPLQALVVYIIDPSTLAIRRAGLAPLVATGFTPSSVAMYVSPTTGRVFAFAGSTTGLVIQFELTPAADGGSTATQVRSFDVGGPVVGLAVDDAQSKLYVVEQNVGIWQYGAEPGDADARTSVDAATSGGGGLVTPLGGVALYTASGVRGYLLAVSGGENAVRIYERQPDAHTFRGSFIVVADGGIDAVESPRHVVVTNRALGSLFPLGMVAVHDGANTAANENFKLVPWQVIATGFTTPLVVDTGPGGTTPDGGTPDGGGDGGAPQPTPVPPPGIGGESPPGFNGGGTTSCNCASASVPGTVLLVLAGVLLLARRRPGA